MKKGIFGTILRAGARAFFRRVLLSAFSGGRRGELWVVDIDNTIRQDIFIG